MNSLFSDAPQVSPRELPYSASDYERLNLSRGEPARKTREAIDSWWLRIPDAARPQTRERFMSSAPAVHLGAYFEIYMHEVLRRMCSEVEVDIGNDDAPRRRPDLRAALGDVAVGVEVTAILGDDAVDPRDRARVDQLYDALNERLRNRSFLVHVNLRQVGPETPGRKLVAGIDDWLEPLDPDVEMRRQEGGGKVPRLQLEHRGWILDLEATPLKPDLRDRSDLRVIGGRMEGSEIASIEDVELDTLTAIDDVGPLGRGLGAKAGHGYELGEDPFVIAALCAGPFVEDMEIEMALMGGPGNDGLWVKGGRPRYTRVSAVLTVTELTTRTAALVEPCLWLNPWAQRPLAADLLPWRRIEFRDDGRPVETPATRSSAEILGVGPSWPYDAEETRACQPS